jgi:hypothetical protein
MNLNTVHSVASAEALIRELDGSRTDTSLQIATRSRHHAAGGEAAIVQAVITWAQAQRRALLDTFAKGPDDDQLSSLASHLSGLCAALICDVARDVEGRNVTPQLRAEAMARMRALTSEVPGAGSRGPQLEIVCADRREEGLARSVYFVDSTFQGTLKSEEAFRDVARVALKRTGLEGVPLGRDERLVEAIGDCLYELFRNTHEHARLDAAGDLVGRSLRGIHARRHAISPEVLEGIVKDSAPLAAYCGRLQARPGRRDLQIVEFSVFDSGPGLAARWRRQPVAELTAEEELDAVAACFGKHATTKVIDGRGMGLPIVIAALRERNGFMRVRSGRLSLYADLGTEADREFGAAPLLRPWSERKNLPAAAGTLFTFMMPIGG